VGIGASAGGLEAIEQFLAQAPPASGLAFIVVQHLDPTHKAMLAELLQRATAMPVREAAGAMRVEPDSVYVIPPNAELTLHGGLLSVTEPTQLRGLRLPIDVLFCSLARELGERAIGVVLSGMGSDGTLGLQAIKRQGGLTLVQDPASAQFDSMPLSAIAAGVADLIGLPGELPEQIVRVATLRRDSALRAAPDDSSAQTVRNILELLRSHSKHDLTSYKLNTVTRRIERRMGVHGLATMSSYEDFLRRNPAELALLFKEMLIGVTGFFRDPATWRALTDTVLPALIARGTPGARFRAWILGCSTGEEAYSLAIAFREVVDTVPGANGATLQIFATDLNPEAVEAARAGWYSAAGARDLGPDRLDRYFQPDGTGFRLRKEIRETVLFAQHDVILDPPFTRLDLLSCRNVLIYFDAALQHRLLRLFHYALKPRGVLILGESESAGHSAPLFSALDSKLRLYERSDLPAVADALDFPTQRGLTSRSTLQEPKVPDYPNLQSLADHVLLQSFSPAAVLVNERGDVLYVSGRIGRFLEPAAGKANWNVHVMARPSIRGPLAAGLRQAVEDKTAVELHELRLDDTDGRPLDLSIHPLAEPKPLQGTILIVFRERPAAESSPAVPESGQPVDLANGATLARAQDEIRTLHREMRSSEEERQAASEELQSANEELQSANEELTTSREESQSMNEELRTINTELQSKLDDLALAQSDMQNLLNSTNIATLFLDSALNVRRFTDRITRIIHLREGDVGRPISDLASTLVYPELHEDAEETLRTLVFSEKQVPTTDGNWLSVRIMPYRTLSNVIQGVVITFVDISAAKELEAHLRNR